MVEALRARGVEVLIAAEAETPRQVSA
jgi:hypothetical protein